MRTRGTSMGCQNERRAAYLSVADIKDENNEASSRLRTNAAMHSQFAELVPSLGDIGEAEPTRKYYIVACIAFPNPSRSRKHK